MMNQQIINIIVEAIIDKIIEKSRKVLLVFTGSPLGLDRTMEDLKQLKEEGYTFTVFASESAKRVLDMEDICRQLGAECCSSVSKPAEFLDKGSMLVVPTLTQNTAARLSLGINDSLIMDILSQGIQRGYATVASTEGCCPDSASRNKIGLGNMPPAYRKMMTDHLKNLQECGIRLANPDDFLGAVKEMSKPHFIRKEQYVTPKPKADPGIAVGSSFRFDKPEEEKVKAVARRVVTLADITTLKEGDTIQLDAKAILTPSAKEFVRDRKIVIVRRT